VSILDTAEYRRLALLAAGVDPSQIPAILDTATWRRLMIAALVAISEGGGGGGGGYVNGSVQFYADLPVTVGTPPVNTAYLVREDSGVWFINRKPAGIYVRLFNNGTLADWDYAGEFPSVNDSQYFRIYDSADPTKELAFDVSGVSAATTRTLTVPDASGKIALQSEAYDFYYATAPSGATGGSGSAWVWNIPSWSTMQVITMIGAGGGGGSGRVGASGTVCGGGGAGGAGAFGTFITRITGGDQIEVLVGAGGAGGAAAGTGNGNGLSGTAGGNTSVRWVTPNITLRQSTGFGAGGGGGGGTATFGTAGIAGAGVASTILGSGGAGGAGVAGSVTGNAGGGSNNNSTQGGRAGGSIDATPTAYNGGALLGSSFTDIRESFLLPNLSPKIGTGAKGGNASTTANAQAGDNAGGLGGGGGGGGAALTGFLSGAGGNGGDAFVRINCF
jgi:hypothetical protein